YWHCTLTTSSNPSPATIPLSSSIYLLSLHDALPIFSHALPADRQRHARAAIIDVGLRAGERHTVVRRHDDDRVVELTRAFECLEDRKSTRLNSSHGSSSYAVFCLKEKKQMKNQRYSC